MFASSAERLFLRHTSQSFTSVIPNAYTSHFPRAGATLPSPCHILMEGPLGSALPVFEKLYIPKQISPENWAWLDGLSCSRKDCLKAQEILQCRSRQQLSNSATRSGLGADPVSYILLLFLPVPSSFLFTFPTALNKTSFFKV